MMDDNKYIFGSYIFCHYDGTLENGNVKTTLLPKDSAVLKCLLDSAGQIVTKQYLLKMVWPDTCVQDGVLKASIRRLRKSLNDDYNNPQYIQTHPRRGYAFLPRVIHMSSSRTELNIVKTSDLGSDLFIGRRKELKKLNRHLRCASTAQRQTVLISGAAGIGKTCLVDFFARERGQDQICLIIRGHCTNSHGPAEPYGPFFEIFGTLADNLGYTAFRNLLRQFGPMWLLQFPEILELKEIEKLEKLLIGTSTNRMLRELCQILESAAQNSPLILIIEDIHWADQATIDALNLLSKRTQATKLMVIITYRRSEIEDPSFLIRLDEMAILENGSTITLNLMTVEHINNYLEQRFKHVENGFDLALWLHNHTEGNPLFFKTLIDHGIEQGWLKLEKGALSWHLPQDDHFCTIPNSLRNLILSQLAGLPSSIRTMLEQASAVGIHFSTRMLGTGEVNDEMIAEEQLSALAVSQRLIKPEGPMVWPDNRQSSTFSFIHSWYRQIIYEQIPAMKKQTIHQHIGERMEQLYDNQLMHSPGILSMHFELGNDYNRAIFYHYKATEIAMNRHAYKELKSLCNQGIRLLEHLVDERRKGHWELKFRLPLGIALIATEGYSSKNVLNVYTRAEELCRKFKESPYVLPILSGLFVYYFERGDILKTGEILNLFVQITDKHDDQNHKVWISGFKCVRSWYQGNYTQGIEYAQQGINNYHPEQIAAQFRYGGFDAGIICMNSRAMILWCLGYPEQAEAQAMETFQFSRSTAEPFMTIWIAGTVALIYLFGRDYDSGLRFANRAVQMGEAHGIHHWQIPNKIFQGYLRVKQGKRSEGLSQLRQYIEAHQSSGARIYRSMFLFLLADVIQSNESIESAMSILDQALCVAHNYGEMWWASEIFRLKGVLLDRLSTPAKDSRQVMTTQYEAETYFKKALETARDQNTKSFELRAANSYAKFLIQNKQPEQANKILYPVYEWFTEGFEKKDLVESRILLKQIKQTVSSPPECR